MSRRRRAAGTAALASDLMLAPMVIGMRLPMMMLEAQTSQGGVPGVETTRAITEKAAAMTRGIAAAQISMVGSMMRFWPEVLSGRVPSVLSGAGLEQAMNAAMRPAGRTVRANFKRLGKP